MDKTYDELMNEIRALANSLSPWFDIDKIKSYGVYVWTKDTDDEVLDGENVFDIFPDCIRFYRHDNMYDISAEAMPVIMDIQKKLKEIEEVLE